MPVPTRRQAQQYQFPPPEEADDTDSDIDITGATGRGGDDDGETIGEEQVEHLGDDDALASPNQPDTDVPNLEPPPPYLREISTSAAWTVSSSKPGCSVPQLRHPSTALFWQSDGPQPHYLNIHFFKLVRIAGLRLYLDFEQDESYTPTRIIFLAGSGMNDLQEWGEMRLESPRGWVWADFSAVGDPHASDSESDDETEDMEHQQLTIQDAPSTTAGTTHDLPASSDSENAIPRPQVSRAPSDDVMQLDAQLHTPPGTHPHPQHTPHHHHDTPPLATTTPSTTTTTTPPTLPHAPFSTLSPNTPASRPRRRSTPKTPILRAHLVQIKILENHQNGKDTHLRGLQVFARNDDEDVGWGPVRGVGGLGVRRVVGGGEGRGGGGGGDMRVVRRGGREERFDLGVGSRSAWDVEPSFR